MKALLRIAVVYNIPIACNRSTADFLLSSPLMNRQYERFIGVQMAQVPLDASAASHDFRSKLTMTR